MSVVYKYDKENRIKTKYVSNIGWICNFMYKKDLRKLYYYFIKDKTKQIVKEKFINNNYVIDSSIVVFKNLKMYIKYENGIKAFERCFNQKTKNTFSIKTWTIGSSEIKEFILKKKDKEQKNIEFKTRYDGRK